MVCQHVGKCVSRVSGCPAMGRVTNLLVTPLVAGSGGGGGGKCVCVCDIVWILAVVFDFLICLFIYTFTVKRIHCFLRLLFLLKFCCVPVLLSPFFGLLLLRQVYTSSSSSSPVLTCFIFILFNVLQMNSL